VPGLKFGMKCPVMFPQIADVFVASMGMLGALRCSNRGWDGSEEI